MLRPFIRSVLLASLTSICAACGGGAESADGGFMPLPDPPSMSNIKHVVIVVQENHTFDDHFGLYCTAAPGSNPTCTDGAACCEAAPAKEPSGSNPVSLTDAEMASYD